MLSCLGKEYLERVTMQNYLQEICKKSGYVYEDVKANMQVQSEAENILEDMIEMRSKALLRSKNKDNGVTESPANGINLTNVPEGIKHKGEAVYTLSYLHSFFDGNFFMRQILCRINIRMKTPHKCFDLLRPYLHCSGTASLRHTFGTDQVRLH